MTLRIIVFLLAITAAASSSAITIVDGNSDEYIIRMELITRGEIILKRSLETLQEAQLTGSDHSSKELGEAIDNIISAQRILNEILTPERIRTKVYKVTPAPEFVNPDVTIEFNKN